MSLPRLFDHPLSLWDPFSDDDGIFSRFARLPQMRDSEGKAAFMPLCDITENDKAYNLTLELPGIKKEDINVSLSDGVLQIEASTRSEEETREDDVVIRRERRYGSYLRRFNLGENVSDNQVSANFENGILSLTIPKKDPSADVKQPTRIAIN